MNDTQEPAKGVKPGDKITHDLLPAFVMQVREAKSCETDWNRAEAHDQYLITDPEGNDDWLCGYDVSPVTS